MGLDYYKSLRILALAEVLRPDASAQYSLRRVFRWYSREFHTPLHLVETLPIHDILTHYYESHYETLEAASSDTALQEELVELSMTEEELAKKKAADDRKEFEDYGFVSEMEAAALAVQKAVKSFDKTETKKPIASSGQRSVNMDAEEPPDIKLTFIDTKELDELIDSDGLEPFEDLVGMK